MRIKYTVTSGTLVDRSEFLSVATYWPVGFPVLDGLQLRERAEGRREIVHTVEADDFGARVQAAVQNSM